MAVYGGQAEFTLSRDRIGLKPAGMQFKRFIDGIAKRVIERFFQRVL